MPEHQAKHSYTANAARFLERVDHVKYALRKPDNELEAQRTHVQFSGNKVFGVDGYRLAWDVDESLTVRRRPGSNRQHGRAVSPNHRRNNSNPDPG